MPTTLKPIPDDLWGRINDLIGFAVPHRTRRDQIEARQHLRAVLDGDRTAELPEALRDLGRSRVRDIHGQIIPTPKQHLKRIASGLAGEVEAWIEDQADRRVA